MNILKQSFWTQVVRWWFTGCALVIFGFFFFFGISEIFGQIFGRSNRLSNHELSICFQLLMLSALPLLVATVIFFCVKPENELKQTGNKNDSASVNGISLKRIVFLLSVAFILIGITGFIFLRTEEYGRSLYFLRRNIEDIFNFGALIFCLCLVARFKNIFLRIALLILTFFFLLGLVLPDL